tara:strand:+ start:146 stop:445 length:300 start_codon:yes stop_codon:yes gene_type:complete
MSAAMAAMLSVSGHKGSKAMTDKPDALLAAKRVMRLLTDAQRDRMLERYLSDGIAADKARIAELEAALAELRDWYQEHTGLPACRSNAALSQQGKEGDK